MNIKVFLLILFLAMVGCGQQRLYFYPVTLPNNHAYKFSLPFTEYNIPVAKNITLNGVLFKQSSASKGLIFYVHGNAGNLEGWYPSVHQYLKNNYDVFIFDYRGFGKSLGRVTNEVSLHQDVAQVYQFIQKQYPEKNIIILGYSMGTGLAAKLASENHPKALFLLTPYYSLPDAIKSHIPLVPKNLVKFQIPTYQYLEKVQVPTYIFHGKADVVIPYHSSERLQQHLKAPHQVFLMEHQGHEFIEGNPEFQRELARILKNL